MSTLLTLNSTLLNHPRAGRVTTKNNDEVGRTTKDDATVAEPGLLFPVLNRAGLRAKMCRCKVVPGKSAKSRDL